MRTFLITIVIVIVALFTIGCAGPKTSLRGNDYIKTTKTSLKTSVMTFYGPNRRKVTLVNTVHVGTADYYRQINAVVADSDVVLYENVKDDYGLISLVMNAPFILLSKASSSVNWCIWYKSLGLEYELDYLQPQSNWILADVTASEMMMIKLNTKSRAISCSVNWVKNLFLSPFQVVDLTIAPITGVTRIAQIGVWGVDGCRQKWANTLTRASYSKNAIRRYRKTVVTRDEQSLIPNLTTSLKDHRSIAIKRGCGHGTFIRVCLKKMGFWEDIRERKWLTVVHY